MIRRLTDYQIAHFNCSKLQVILLLISVLDKNGLNESCIFIRDQFLYRISGPYSFLCCLFEVLIELLPHNSVRINFAETALQ